MAKRGPFEKLCDAVRETYLEAIRESLPLDGKGRALWKTPDALAWIGLIEEQDRFSLSLSFGELVASDPFVRTNLGTKAFDYLEQWRLNREMFPRTDTGRLDDAYSDVLCEDPPEDEDLDEDDWEDARTDLRRLAAHVAMGLFARKLRAEPELLPMPVSANFAVTVSDDRETPTWPAKLRAPGVRDETIRTRMLDRLCGDEASRTLFEGLLREAERAGGRVELLEVLAKVTGDTKQGRR